MTTRLKDLLPASFKGISFYVRSEVLTEGGRRLILHDYPNSSERYVEDLGLLPPKFSITAFVSGTDFLTRADQLEKALQADGQGTLSMPTLGSIKVFALPYRKDASMREVGEIRFELSFVAGKSISGPGRAPITVEGVFSRGDTARSAIGDALEKLWINPSSTSNVLTAIYDLEQATKQAESLITSLDNEQDVLSIMDFIGLNSPTIVRLASYLRQIFIDDLWQSESEGLSQGAGYQSLVDQTSFGSELSLVLADIRSASVAPSLTDSTDIPLWDEDTGIRKIRNSNRLTLINTHRVCALVCAYEQAADRTYSTDVELDAARLDLETQHQRLMRADTEDRDLVQSQPAVRRAVEDLRLAAIEILDEKDQSTYSLTTIDLNVKKSAYVLAYDLYAEDFTTTDQINDRTIVIRNLNPELPADRLIGDISVLQS